MVSEDSTSNPNSSILHQFIISNSINAGQPQFSSENFDAYATDLSGSCTYSSLGSVPGLHSLGERIPRAVDLLHAHPHQMTDESDIGHRQLMDLLGASNEPNYHAQRLSLSLGTCTLVSPVHGRQRFLNSNLMNSVYIIGGENGREVCNPRSECINNSYSYGGNVITTSSTSPSRSCSTSYGTEFLAAAIGNSKYLKPTQSLLDEMVKVSGNAIDLSNEKYVKRLSRSSKTGSLKLRSELTLELANIEGCNEKHELETQILKLIALLEEVERRYEQYYNRMDELVSSFELIAGLGTGKSYTALALQAMSRHFCSLRDSILSQICATRQKISPDMPKISAGISQLSLFDRENRQNRLSLQQLGMIQSSRQAWRPIRGLPETSVAILRSWLFEHFLHPYPNDSEKLMLASQTGLTKNQVSNWFINARVRLWKPMIEEMYKEEFAESSLESNPSLTQEGFADSAED